MVEGGLMASIIDIRFASSRSEVRERGRTGSAEIIIFPGVRRERHADHPDAPRPKRRERGKPKRDRLELPE